MRLGFERGGAAGSKAAAMDGRGAELGEGPKVLGSGVAFVIPEAVLGIFFVQFGHEAVARDFGEDAGGGDGKTFGVAIDQGGLGMERGKDVRAVDQGMVWCGRELQERLVHGTQAGLEDIDGIDDLDIHGGDGPGNEWRLGEEIEEAFPILFGELLGIVEPLQLSGEAIDNPGGREANHGGHNRAGERAPAGFIGTRHAGTTALETFALEFELTGPHDGSWGLDRALRRRRQCGVVRVLCTGVEDFCNITITGRVLSI